MIEHEINRLKSVNYRLGLLLALLLNLQGLVQARQHLRSTRDWRNGIQQQRILLVSFGGFRYDFIDNYGLKNFGKFAAESAWAAHLNPQFTTQAFPNHWSIATGAFVEEHGIIANKFYDPHYNDYFHENSKEFKWWNNSEPFWFNSVRKGMQSKSFRLNINQ